MTAKRLIRRMFKGQARMVDVFCFYGLYLDSKFLNLLEKKNKYWIAVLKQKNRDTYKEIDNVLPKTERYETKINDREVCLFDMPELVVWDNLDKSFIAVILDEKWLVYKRISKEEKLRSQEPLIGDG